MTRARPRTEAIHKNQEKYIVSETVCGERVSESVCGERRRNLFVESVVGICSRRASSEPVCRERRWNLFAENVVGICLRCVWEYEGLNRRN